MLCLSLLLIQIWGYVEHFSLWPGYKSLQSCYNTTNCLTINNLPCCFLIKKMQKKIASLQMLPQSKASLQAIFSIFLKKERKEKKSQYLSASFSRRAGLKMLFIGCTKIIWIRISNRVGNFGNSLIGTLK